MDTATGFTGYVEVRAGFVPRPGVRHVLFDFDGTLSLIRQGWPEVMLPMFLEMVPRREGESEEALRQSLWEDIMQLNGKQTIYQMMRFAERVRERGGEARDPRWYKEEYLRRLHHRIAGRREALSNGSQRPDAFLVEGARPFLEYLCGCGIRMYLASGTDEPFVKEEAALLDLTRYFGEHIYGAQDDHRSFSKKMVIDRILTTQEIPGSRLLAFGDGYVEIENTKQVGGLAVAVASDEARNGSGRIDRWKRDRLWGVGADIVIPDYRDAVALVQWMTGK